MPDACHVYTDLVSSSGFQLKLHISIISKTFKNFIMSNCRFSVFLIDSHFFAVNRMPSNRAFDGSLIFGYISADNANVDAVDGMFFDLLCNVYVTFIIFAYNAAPTRCTWPQWRRASAAGMR